jgi:hypothetical protein
MGGPVPADADLGQSVIARAALIRNDSKNICKHVILCCVGPVAFEKQVRKTTGR